MSTTKNKVLKYFAGDFNCCQSVLVAVIEEKGLSFIEAPYVAAGFGGGIIGRGEVCGAVSGAVMAIGVLNGHLYNDIIKIKEQTRVDAELFYEKFTEKFGHNTCDGLIGIDRSNPEERQKAIDEGIYRENCPKFVAQAAAIVLDIFKDRL